MPILKDQSTNWDFQVDNIAAPAFEHDGVTVKPDHFLNVRRDTGEVLGVSEGTISWRVSEARKHLRRIREEEDRA